MLKGQNSKQNITKNNSLMMNQSATEEMYGASTAVGNFNANGSQTSGIGGSIQKTSSKIALNFMLNDPSVDSLGGAS